ncbi:cellulose-binding protein [Stenotrophomonas sp. HMWF022]|uniref:lytic polysaccharide monooxygenase auxiliary activity family 9 protein n=1 Tax=Stenotrophomonas sp. HMWF023 TaxID=2056859 RepID=UPI000D352B4C|nr:lytic polysaccharide monooxygenase [Stenotrophomonas sp. HMWF023]PTS79815.1 cellulose-binding protein [Stenotrophomonas sp. HMWF023]PTT58368.1 cellulose-binding protein [Stenotrophomonas sp. HMWF022]
MSHRNSRALLAVSLALGGLAAAGAVQAHGTMVKPMSRVYACYQGNPENPTNPACAAAKAAGGAQAFYDWAGVNQADAAGNHQAVVPDGKLCSGNNPTYTGLDLRRSDWQTTPIRPDAQGRYTFEFKGAAPHATREWKFYVTRETWKPGSELRWSDLEAFCTLGNTALSADGTYKLNCPLPKRTGPHIIYNTWQRSDSNEAFYSCMDVKFEGGSTTPPTWLDAGALIARGALPVDTSVELRVFNGSGGDAERVSTTLPSGQTAPTQWPLYVARKVNSSAVNARIGVMNNGVITPVASATANRVYLKQGFTHQVDIRTPGEDFDHLYPAGIGSYVPGQTVVKGSDGKLYACRPFPEGAWCNINAAAYVPGVGYAWRDAWLPY